MRLTPHPIKTVGQLGEEYLLVTDSQDAAAVRASIGQVADGYTMFFVLPGEGDYREVWGTVGTVPYRSKLVARLV